MILAIVLVGTLYPLVLDAVTGEKISVGAPFFNLTFGPLMVPLLLAVPFGPILSWKRADLGAACQRLYAAFGLALLLTLVTYWAWGMDKVLAPLGRMPFLKREQILATYDPEEAPTAGLPSVLDLVRDGAWICGPPEHVYERICEYQERLPGLKRVSVGAGALAIPPSVLRRNIEWFGREVLPRFDGVAAAAG